MSRPSSARLALPWLLLAACLAACPAPILAWGPIGHSSVALVAQSLLSPRSLTALKYYLPNTSGQLEPIASWADQVRATTQPWNRPLHGAFTPRDAGQYLFNRDCWSNRTTSDWLAGCTDGAIQNYTHRLANVDHVNYTQRVEALMYVTHFVGDIAQPLHGGFWDDHSGDTTVGTWFGNRTTLHTVWDRSLINALLAANYSNNATLWAAHLVRTAALHRRDFPAWTSCEHSVVADPWQACTDLWIGESNRLCTSHVYRYNATGPRFNQSTGFVLDAATHYYEYNVPVVEFQVVRAGVRLAHVLDRIFETFRPTRLLRGASTLE